MSLEAFGRVPEDLVHAHTETTALPGVPLVPGNG